MGSFDLLSVAGVVARVEEGGKDSIRGERRDR
jgi:hypothetical protein